MNNLPAWLIPFIELSPAGQLLNATALGVAFALYNKYGNMLNKFVEDLEQAEAKARAQGGRVVSAQLKLILVPKIPPIVSYIVTPQTLYNIVSSSLSCAMPILQQPINANLNKIGWQLDSVSTSMQGNNIVITMNFKALGSPEIPLWAIIAILVIVAIILIFFVEPIVQDYFQIQAMQQATQQTNTIATNTQSLLNSCLQETGGNTEFCQQLVNNYLNTAQSVSSQASQTAVRSQISDIVYVVAGIAALALIVYAVKK